MANVYLSRQAEDVGLYYISEMVVPTCATTKILQEHPGIVHFLTIQLLMKVMLSIREKFLKIAFC